MNWLKKSYNISTKTPISMYAITDPIEFYEWQYNGVIPKGTKFSKFMPRSDRFVSGDLIITAEIDPSNIDANEQLKYDILNNAQLSVGEVFSPKELMDRFKNLIAEFNRKLHHFKINSVSQKYLVGLHDKPTLYRLSNLGDTVRVECLGSLLNIGEKLLKAKESILSKSKTKQGRSYELSDIRHIDNLLTYMKNTGVPMDSNKYDLLNKYANLSPETDNNMSWESCYIKISPEGKDIFDRINKFKSFNWVKAVISRKF